MSTENFGHAHRGRRGASIARSAGKHFASLMDLLEKLPRDKRNQPPRVQFFKRDVPDPASSSVFTRVGVSWTPHLVFFGNALHLNVSDAYEDASRVACDALTREMELRDRHSGEGEAARLVNILVSENYLGTGRDSSQGKGKGWQIECRDKTPGKSVRATVWLDEWRAGEGEALDAEAACSAAARKVLDRLFGFAHESEANA